MTSSNSSFALLDAAELAELLRVSKPTIWRLREKCKLPPAISLTSQCVRWRKSDVESWIERGCPPFNLQAPAIASSEVSHV